MKTLWFPALLYSIILFRSTLSVIQTSSGPINGILRNYETIVLDVYLGIPYAVPPLGNLRFRRTVPVQPWPTPLLADSYAPACVQYYPYNYPWVDSKPGQSEDCLYLNVWAPRSTNTTKGKAVMFWIYGGGFSYGSNRLENYDGDIMAAEGDVIVVTANYRLGVLGFLTTPSEESLGNMGLFDIVEALRWVKSNIHAFGGDPEQITVFGFSAGSIAAGLLCTSPLATGLFNRVIMQSGAPTRLNEDNTYMMNLELGDRLAAAVGCRGSNLSLIQDPVDIIQCLRSKDAYLLAFTTETLKPGSVVSFDYIYGDDLLPMNPRLAVLDLLIQNADILIGNVPDEGSFKLTSNMAEVFGPFGEKNPQINKSFGSDIIRKQFNGFPAPEAVVEKYLSGLNEYDHDQVLRQVYHSYGDYTLFCPDVYFAESYSRKNNSVYYYYFVHRPSVRPWANWMGVVHADEVPFVFGRPVDSPKPYMDCEKELSKNLVAFWSNFAKYGIPHHDWPRFSRENRDIVMLQLPGDENGQLNLHLDNCEFFRPYFGYP